MIGKPPKKTLRDRFLGLAEQQLGAIGILHRRNLPLPYLMVLYSTLDVFAYIWGGGRDAGGGGRFRDFTDRYVVPHMTGVTAFDLWGARCAILHTGSADSTSSNRGQARRLLYSWGAGRIEMLREVIRTSPRPETYAAVTLEDLEQAVSDGLADFLVELELKDDLRKSCEPRLKEVYSTIDLKKLNEKEGSGV